MTTPRESRPSARPSTTSATISSGRGHEAAAALQALVEGLPPDLRDQVFTHASWAEDRTRSYERLEFLGDSVLGLAIAQTLYERFPDVDEGRLAKLRAHIVSRQSCAVVGRELDLGRELVERGGSLPPDELERLSRNRNVLAALVEAILGALYLEHGFEPIREAVVDAFAGRIDYALTTHVDHKTELQEELARLGRHVQYVVREVEGPPHDRRFTCAALIDGADLGTGTGTSKKAAEQAAARQALECLAAEAAASVGGGALDAATSEP
ncbi:MAG: ribonuclease III [Thermoleophilia bacterium]